MAKNFYVIRRKARKKHARILNSWAYASGFEVKDKNMSGSELELTSLTADVVAAYVANNVISTDKIPEFIGSVHTALKNASVQGVEPPKVELTPAVSVKKSVTQD